MVVTERRPWLADKSALVRLHLAAESHLWTTRVSQGLIRVTTATLLEIGFSARSATDWVMNLEEPPVSMMPIESFTPASERRAVEVQGLLAKAGHHRAPSVPDLLIAATAEVVGLTVLHVDKDFDLIAEVTDQPMERLQVDP